ncbi:GSCOCG00007946001-RA-CDS [Cotesia congregata]|nr:GSCOCG00007946001-RA-CDS [Cotesia congregata]
MDTWLAWKMLVSSIILIGGSESCSITYNRPLDEVLEPNNRSPWLVLVVDTVEKEYAAMSGLSYGSLIKEDVVFTAASKIARLSSSQLEVVINWQITDETIYDSRLVSLIGTPLNFDKNQVKPSDWAILILHQPFELYGKVGIIPLADKSHQWDSEDCYIYRWIYVEADYKIESRYIEAEGFLHREYRVSLTSNSSRLDEEKMVELFYELDSIMLNGHRTFEGERFIKKISFVGSPIVCKLLDQDQYVQVGLTTFVAQWSVYATEYDLDIEDISEYDEDTFVDLIKDFDEVIIPLISIA